MKFGRKAWKVFWKLLGLWVLGMIAAMVSFLVMCPLANSLLSLAQDLRVGPAVFALFSCALIATLVLGAVYAYSCARPTEARRSE